MSAYLSDLEVRLVDDQANEGRGEWEHLAPLIYQSDVAECTITCEKGERTDFASVPRDPLVFVLYGDRAHRPAATHDHLYRTRELPRDLCDRVLREAMLVVGCTEEEADAFYFGVRAGGDSHYGAGSPIAVAPRVENAP